MNLVSKWKWLLLSVWLFALAPLLSAAAEPSSLGLLEVVETALETDPNILLSASQVESSRATALIAAGRFDIDLTADLEADDEILPRSETTVLERQTFTESVSAQLLLPTGQTLQTSLTFVQVDDGDPVSTGTFAFTVRQPLWRGRQEAVVSANVAAAESDLEASQLDLVQSISRRLLVVVNQYWAARAAMLDLEILREAEKRSREFLASTRRLVEADLTPAADLIQLEADLISRESTRVSGERALFRARQSLGEEIGLGADQIASLAFPADPFPTVDPKLVPENPRAYLAEAMKSRADLMAAQQRLRTTDIRLMGAEDAVKPQLDLIFTPSFRGLVEGDDAGDALSSIGRNVPGLSTTIGISYSFSIGNKVAEGALVRAGAARVQQSLNVDSRKVQIGADVPVALDAVRTSSVQLIKLERAVELFEQTLEHEEKRLRAGSSTLIDVLNQRDRLTSARQRRVSAKLALAQALVSLRFETGTLIGRSQDGVQSVRLENLTTLPLGGD